MCIGKREYLSDYNLVVVPVVGFELSLHIFATFSLTAAVVLLVALFELATTFLLLSSVRVFVAESGVRLSSASIVVSTVVVSIASWRIGNIVDGCDISVGSWHGCCETTKMCKYFDMTIIQRIY